MPLIHIIKSFSGKKALDLPKNIIWRLPIKRSSQKHIFVVGAPRSGTTLLKSILCAHSNLNGLIYENTGIFNYSNPFNIKRYSYTISEQEFPIDDLEKYFKNSSNIVPFFDEFTQAYLSRNGGTRFVEKSSITLFRLQLLSYYFPKAKFVNIFRDGRDCYCSARRHPHIFQGSDVKQFAKYWKDSVNARLDHKNDSNVFDVQYETLTSQPEKTVRELMEFLGEDYVAEQLSPSYYSNPMLSQTVYHQNLSKPINSSSQNRWKKELNADELDQFYQIAGKQLLEVGYSIE